MASAQEIYDQGKQIKQAVRDQKAEIKRSIKEDDTMEHINDELRPLETKIKILKKKKKEALENFRSNNKELYSSLKAVETSMERNSGELVKAVVENMVNGQVTRVMDTGKKGIPVEVDITLLSKTKKV